MKIYQKEKVSVEKFKKVQILLDWKINFRIKDELVLARHCGGYFFIRINVRKFKITLKNE